MIKIAIISNKEINRLLEKRQALVKEEKDANNKKILELTDEIDFLNREILNELSENLKKTQLVKEPVDKRVKNKLYEKLKQGYRIASQVQQDYSKYKKIFREMKEN